MTPTDPISFQLYSARNFPPDAAVLAMLADCGYTNVETYRPQHEDAEGFRRLLDANGLTAKSGHFALAMAEAEFDRVVAIARTLGIETVVIPYLAPEERPADRAGWEAVGERLAKLSTDFADEALRLAWHNHDFEFVALPDGSYPIEHLLAPGVLWEADVAWIARADADPEPWLKRYAGRIAAVHVKDIAPEGEKLDEDGWADVGDGVVDWARFWPLAARSGAALMIAEHDNPSDLSRFARTSAERMSALAASNN